MASDDTSIKIRDIGFSLQGNVSQIERHKLERRIQNHIAEHYSVISNELNQPGCRKRGNGKSFLQLCIDRRTGQIFQQPKQEETDENRILPADAEFSLDSEKKTEVIKESRKLMKYLMKASKTLSSISPISEVTLRPENSVNSSGHNSKVAKKRRGSRNAPDVISFSDNSMEAAILFASSKKSPADTKPQKAFVCRKQQQLSRKVAKSETRLSVLKRSSASKGTLSQTSEPVPTLAKSKISNVVKIPQVPKILEVDRILSDGYDLETKAEEFKQQFPDLRGKFEIFYSHGETHCKKTLLALGFHETKSSDNDDNFRANTDMLVLWCNGRIASAKRRMDKLGFYIVNRVRYRGLITNKCSLVRTLEEFEDAYPHIVPKGLEHDTFLPQSLHINGSSAFDIFDMIRTPGVYLLKPGYTDCGKGIALYRSDGKLAPFLEFMEKEYGSYGAKDLMLQRYIEKPLLLERKKFDLRVFILVIPNQQKEKGVYAFFHPGYVRLACRDFSLKSNNLLIHLTNQAVQCRDKLYPSVKEKTVWSPDTFNSYLNRNQSELRVPCHDWVRKILYPRIKAILAHIISVASSSMVERPMSFELFGCDFLIDTDFGIWLLEINSDPSLCKSTAVLHQIISQVMEEAIAISVEVLQRSSRKLPIRKLTSVQDFSKIFSHNNDSVIKSVLSRAQMRLPVSKN